MVNEIPKNNISAINNLDNLQMPVVVHWYNSVYDLNEVTVDSTFVSGLLSLSENTFDYRFHTSASDKVYKRSERNNINTVHIYLLYSHLKPEPGLIKIDTKYISRVEIVENNTRKTTISHLAGWASISLVVAGIVAGIINPPASRLTFPSIGL